MRYGLCAKSMEYAEQVLVCLSTKNVNPKGMDWLLRLAEDVPPRENDLFLDEHHFASWEAKEPESYFILVFLFV